MGKQKRSENTYQKINTLYKRDINNIIMQHYEWSCPEFEYLRTLLWDASEKIDGTNMRIEVIQRPVLKLVSEDIVGVQFRNMATVGGSIWGRFGFSDVLTIFLALDTYVELYKGGIVSLEEFAKMKADNDILVRLIVKKVSGKVVYSAMRNQSTDFPVLTCAVSDMSGIYKAVIGARPEKAVVFY